VEHRDTTEEDGRVKAEPAVQRRLLDLAEIDAELSRLAHRRRTLPEHAELTEAEAAVRSGRDKLVEVETTAGDLDRDIRRIERDVEGVRARTERDNKLLAGSGIGAKQATELQHELETLARRQGVLEDEQLEIMEQREAVGSDVEHARVQVAAAEQRIADITGRRDTALADIDAADAGRRRDREKVLTEVPADLLGAYEQRREKRGIGAAKLVARRCQACRLELDRTAISELRAAPADEVVYCEECGTILVRSPESGL
jgi:predicted  nucleic acid-binding Zn-ribbon protein